MKQSIIRQILFVIGLLLFAGIARAGEAARIVFVAGDVYIAGQRVALDHAVNEGDELTTGNEGYVYLKMTDNGFLILRPNSRARVVTYHIDAQNPANTRIKLELLNGVARSISGQAVKRARQNFRFNTPVAAIGVRGTDFTVFADQNVSRVAVSSGGVVVSGFAGACTPEGGGPCEGDSSRELFAEQTGSLLQVRGGQPVPQLLHGNAAAPDAVAPPRPDEPGVKGVGTASLDAEKSANLLSAALVDAPPYRQIVWGRWQPLLDQAGNVDVVGVANAGGQILAINSYFAVLRSGGVEWQTPNRGSMGFALNNSEAYIVSGPSRALAPAALENGRLQVDFAKATFSTGFDLVSQQGERFGFQALGDVSRDGRLLGASPSSAATNMIVSGAVGPENGGSAAYIFQGRIDAGRLAIGGASWVKN